MGDIGCFSIYPARNLGAYGDSGMAVTDNPQIADEGCLLRDHGRREKYEHLHLGSNGRLASLQVAILRVKLHRLGRWNARRWAINVGHCDALQAVFKGT